MRTLSTRSKLVVGATVAALAVGSSTAAYAFFSTSGTGNGSSSTTGGVSGGLTFVGSPSAALFPGDNPAPINGTVTNSSTTQSAYVAAVHAYLTVVKATGAPAGTCDATDYLLAGSATAASPATEVAATFTATDLTAGASAPFTIALKFNDKTTNQDSCKGATVTINYIAN